MLVDEKLRWRLRDEPVNSCAALRLDASAAIVRAGMLRSDVTQTRL